jgi:repressor LexA
VRDIGRQVGLASPSTVFTHINALEEKGFIRKVKESARSLIVMDKGWEELAKHGYVQKIPDDSRLRETAVFGGSGIEQFVELPVVGQIAAGEPILADHNIEDTFTVPKQLVGDRGSFMLRVKGNSMIGAGINNGDYVVVREQPTADNGDIVVALLDDEATVKTFYREKDGIRLQPQNYSMQPVVSKDVKVIGKVIALLRSL